MKLFSSLERLSRKSYDFIIFYIKPNIKSAQIAEIARDRVSLKVPEKI